MSEKAVPPKTATALEVARLAGVSQSTVSRVFNPYNTLHIRDKTRQQVLRAAEALGYSPNAIAKTMASGRSGIIGIVVPSTYNLFHYQALQELTNILKRDSLRTMVITAEPTDHVNDLLRGLSQYQVDGVVITSAVLGQNAIGDWRQNQTPVVLFNSDLPDAQVHSVQCDHFQGGVQMADHLVKQGYQRFAYVSAEKSVHLDISSRREGFLSGLREHGIPDCRIVPAAYSYESGFEAGRLLLAQEPVPDAIFCGGDVNGFGVIDAIRTLSRFQLGKDVGVAGYEAPITGAFQSYPMTTLVQPTKQLALDTVRLLMRLVENPETPVQQITHLPTLEIRASTLRQAGKTDGISG